LPMRGHFPDDVFSKRCRGPAIKTVFRVFGVVNVVLRFLSVS
jgi:hypothetical protein